MDKFEERDRIVFGHPIEWEKRQSPSGIAKRFEGLDASGIEKLIALGFMTHEQTMNSSPSVVDFLAFAKEMEAKGWRFLFEGFTFAPSNKYHKVCLEGIYSEGEPPAEIGLAFANFVSSYHPDELKLGGALRAWWD